METNNRRVTRNSLRKAQASHNTETGTSGCGVQLPQNDDHVLDANGSIKGKQTQLFSKHTPQLKEKNMPVSNTPDYSDGSRQSKSTSLSNPNTEGKETESELLVYGKDRVTNIPLSTMQSSPGSCNASKSEPSKCVIQVLNNGQVIREVSLDTHKQTQKDDMSAVIPPGASFNAASLSGNSHSVTSTQGTRGTKQISGPYVIGGQVVDKQKRLLVNPGQVSFTASASGRSPPSTSLTSYISAAGKVSGQPPSSKPITVVKNVVHIVDSPGQNNSGRQTHSLLDKPSLSTAASLSGRPLSTSFTGQISLAGRPLCSVPVAGVKTVNSTATGMTAKFIGMTASSEEKDSRRFSIRKHEETGKLVAIVSPAKRSLQTSAPANSNKESGKQKSYKPVLFLDKGTPIGVKWVDVTGKATTSVQGSDRVAISSSVANQTETSHAKNKHSEKALNSEGGQYLIKVPKKSITLDVSDAHKTIPCSASGPVVSVAGSQMSVTIGNHGDVSEKSESVESPMKTRNGWSSLTFVPKVGIPKTATTGNHGDVPDQSHSAESRTKGEIGSASVTPTPKVIVSKSNRVIQLDLHDTAVPVTLFANVNSTNTKDVNVSNLNAGYVTSSANEKICNTPGKEHTCTDYQGINTEKSKDKGKMDSSKDINGGAKIMQKKKEDAISGTTALSQGNVMLKIQSINVRNKDMIAKSTNTKPDMPVSITLTPFQLLEKPTVIVERRHLGSDDSSQDAAEKYIIKQNVRIPKSQVKTDPSHILQSVSPKMTRTAPITTTGTLSTLQTRHPEGEDVERETDHRYPKRQLRSTDEPRKKVAKLNDVRCRSIASLKKSPITESKKIAKSNGCLSKSVASPKKSPASESKKVAKSNDSLHRSVAYSKKSGDSKLKINENVQESLPYVEIDVDEMNVEVNMDNQQHQLQGSQCMGSKNREEEMEKDPVEELVEEAFARLESQGPYCNFCRKRHKSACISQSVGPFCDLCEAHHKNGECLFYTPSKVIFNTVAYKNCSVKSLTSLPTKCFLSACVRDRSHGLAVFASDSFAKGTQFGPLEGTPVKFENLSPSSASDLTHIWFVPKDTEGREMILLSTEDETKSNWCRYLRTSTSLDECNLIAFPCDDSIYYVSRKEIETGDELVVMFLFVLELASHYKGTCSKLKERTTCNYPECVELKFESGFHYMKHVAIFHPITLLKRKTFCKMCKEVTLSYGELAKHAKDNHDGKGAFVCEHCGKDCLKRNILTNHFHDNHAPQGTYVCSTCGKVFSVQRKLYYHQRWHLPKTWLCTKCGISFRGHVFLKRHMITHEPELRKFSCDICGMKTRDFYNLKVHLTKHTGVGKYRCSEHECSETFSTKTGMMNHYKNSHGYTEETMPKIRSNFNVEDFERLKTAAKFSEKAVPTRMLAKRSASTKAAVKLKKTVKSLEKAEDNDSDDEEEDECSEVAEDPKRQRPKIKKIMKQPEKDKEKGDEDFEAAEDLNRQRPKIRKIGNLEQSGKGAEADEDFESGEDLGRQGGEAYEDFEGAEDLGRQSPESPGQDSLDKDSNVDEGSLNQNSGEWPLYEDMDTTDGCEAELIAVTIETDDAISDMF